MTLWHLLSACPIYASSAYTHRHNATLRLIYYHLRHSYGINDNPTLPQTLGDIKAVVGNERCRIYWNYPFPTVRPIQANRPDIVLLDHNDKTIYVIEFSAPSGKDIMGKEEQKREKYQDLLAKLRKLYDGHSVKLVVLVIGSLGGARTTLLQQLRQVPAFQNAAERLAVSMQAVIDNL